MVNRQSLSSTKNHANHSLIRIKMPRVWERSNTVEMELLLFRMRPERSESKEVNIDFYIKVWVILANNSNSLTFFEFATQQKAQKLCPDIHAFQVAEKHGKASLGLYRNASKRVVNIMKRFCPHIERASIDECYLDLTEIAKKYRLPENPKDMPNCWVSENNSVESSFQSLKERADDITRATQLVADIRRTVKNELGFTCSAGISINKMAAKFIAGLKKPNAQSVLYPEQVDEYFKTVPIRKLRGLGGKLGVELCANFNIQLCGQVANITDAQLERVFGRSEAQFIRDMSKGKDDEPVKLRLTAESCGSGRNFLGRDKIIKLEQLNVWVDSLLSDLYERLDEYREDDGLAPKKLIVHLAWVGN